jgi:hypothetical protein
MKILIGIFRLKYNNDQWVLNYNPYNQLFIRVSNKIMF